MAAYAALVSLMHIIDQIKHHPHPPICLDESQVESLTEKVTFLQIFLEGYPHVSHSKDADALESRIADAAYAAEDVIESHIVDQIHAGFASHKRIRYSDQDLQNSTSHGKKFRSTDFYEGLQKVIEEMNSIKKDVMEIKEKMGVQDQLHGNSPFDGSFRSSSAGPNITMVGFDDVALEIMDKLIGGRLDRLIIPIVGMGGIGKTTLARNIYQNPIVVHRFDILVWVTISQEYKMKEIFLELLQDSRGGLSQTNEYELGDELHKRLSGRRYLIIMDDIWDIEVWDQLKFFFPDDNIGSRIMLTTRLSNLASQVANSYCIDMTFLDEDNSWDLFSKIVFVEEDCPHELEEIGKKIVKNCKGLPLSIVVVGGLLSKSKHTRENWEYIEENLNSVVNLEDDKSCLKILHMSYKHLPIYLKPCFLHMGVFKEDSAIRVSTLIKLWVAEGFLKPISGKGMEEIAKDYLKELISRNLILVHEWGLDFCSIHDLIRDLCLREAQKERFYYVKRQHNLIDRESINTERCIVIHNIEEEKVLDALQSTSLARSLISDIERVVPLAINSRLLRILNTFNKRPHDGYNLENMFQLVNSRFLALPAHSDSKFPSSVYLLWNLQTLIVKCWNSKSLTAPAEIWNMPQLRHIIFSDGLYLPDPPSGCLRVRDDIVLVNLQTLAKIKNFKCSEEVVKRIPNIKELEIHYDNVEGNASYYYLNNLQYLHKLESLCCSFGLKIEPSGTDFVQNLTLAQSLKKLTLEASRSILWEDNMLEKIGSLPLLEKLTLYGGSFKEDQWKTIEGQFRSLKFLKIDFCQDLKYWTTEISHFPRLERLYLRKLFSLEEIPSEIGEFPLLQSIKLERCSYSAIFSAKKILEEQEELHGEAALHVQVLLLADDEALESLESPNFIIQS